MSSAPTLNPADETIRVGPLTIHFLLTGAQSNGSVAAFELFVAAGARLPGPAHSHDHYEETVAEHKKKSDPNPGNPTREK